MDSIRASFKELINEILPAKYQHPVRFSHCFNKIILDWLFQDAWYSHLNKKKTAISQLSDEQLQAAIVRMNEWLSNQEVLIKDNQDSLRYRKKLTQ